MNAGAPDASTVLITSDSRVAPAAKRSSLLDEDGSSAQLADVRFPLPVSTRSPSRRT